MSNTSKDCYIVDIGLISTILAYFKAVPSFKYMISQYVPQFKISSDKITLNEISKILYPREVFMAYETPNNTNYLIVDNGVYGKDAYPCIIKNY